MTAMEWSSDGYVLAVGWTHGWAIFSVGGRCLASGFGVEDHIDGDRWARDLTKCLGTYICHRFQDTFMHAVENLVSMIRYPL